MNSVAVGGAQLLQKGEISFRYEENGFNNDNTIDCLANKIANKWTLIKFFPMNHQIESQLFMVKPSSSSPFLFFSIFLVLDLSMSNVNHTIKNDDLS
jgi:hypothetical protein